LGVVPTESNKDAAYATAPLGNNAALNEIEFVLNTNQELSDTSTTLKSQLASIYNLFANYSSNIPNNLAAWGVTTESGGTIQADLSGSTNDVNNN